MFKERRNSDFKDSQNEESMMELQNSCYEELRSIIANVTWNNPVSNTLFRGKFLVLLLDNLLPCLEPNSPFKSTFVICAAKLKKPSELEKNETFCETSISSYAGNPLLIQFEKLFCPVPESKQSVSVLQRLNMMYDIYPLSVGTGKQLLFMLSKIENQYKLNYISICHGSTMGNLQLYGAGGKNNACRLKLLTEGNVSSLESLPSIEDLKASHLEGLLPSSSQIRTCVSTIFEFLGDESHNNSKLALVKGAHLSVECKWSEVRTILEPLPIECICFVKLKAVAGDDESGAFLRYKEIKLIKALQQTLNKDMMTGISSNTTGLFQETTGFENSVTSFSSNSLDLVLQEINELVDEERKKIENQEFPELPDKVDDLETAIATERIFLTLPDKLWLILKNCASFEDLLKAIQHIYKVFARLNVLSPLAYNNDLSTISKDITSMFNKKLHCTELNKKKAAELLLEIGVEKLRRDYYEYFIRHGFITLDLFNLFTHSELMSPEAVTCLEKLHSVLELTLVCMKHLELPRSSINNFVRKALEMYTAVKEIDLQHVFTFHIPARDIHPILTMMRPVVWDLSLKSEHRNFMKQSCHHFVTAATHDHIYAAQKINPFLMLKGTSYVYYTSTLIKENVQLNND